MLCYWVVFFAPVALHALQHQKQLPVLAVQLDPPKTQLPQAGPKSRRRQT